MMALKIQSNENELVRMYRDRKQRRLEYMIELVKLASKIKAHDADQDESDCSDELKKPEYSNISTALKVLQFIIDNDEEGADSKVQSKYVN